MVAGGVDPDIARRDLAAECRIESEEGATGGTELGERLRLRLPLLGGSWRMFEAENVVAGGAQFGLSRAAFDAHTQSGLTVHVLASRCRPDHIGAVSTNAAVASG